MNDNHDGIVQVFMQYKHQKKGLKADVNPTVSFDGFGGCSLHIADLSVSEYHDEIDAIKHGFQYKKHPKFK